MARHCTMSLNMRPRPPAQRRPPTRGGSVAWFNVYGSFRQIIQDLVAPSLAAIQGKLEALNSKIDSLNTKLDRSILDARINEVHTGRDAKIEGVRGEIHGLHSELRELRLDVRQKWEQSLAVHERLAAIEAKLEIR